VVIEVVNVAIRASKESEIVRIGTLLRQEGLKQVGGIKQKEFYQMAKFQGELRECNRVLKRNQDKFSTND
jgi:hypothetical protein